MDLKNRGKETPCYLLEGLADFLGLELTAEMLKLGVGKFSLTNYLLRRLLPIVPKEAQCVKRKETGAGYLLVYHVPDPPSRDFEASKV